MEYVGIAIFVVIILANVLIYVGAAIMATTIVVMDVAEKTKTLFSRKH